MTYAPHIQSMSRQGGAALVEQKDVERILKNLIARQSGGYQADGTQPALPGAVRKSSFEGWKLNQIIFARRIARITAAHAQRHKAKFCWKHHSIGLLRRLALVIMVATVLAVQYV